MVLLGQKEKRGFYMLMEKYDNVYPELGNALSNFIQGKSSKRDLLAVFNHLDPETLEFEEFVFLDDTLGLEMEILMSDETEDIFDDVLLNNG